MLVLFYPPVLDGYYGILQPLFLAGPEPSYIPPAALSTSTPSLAGIEPASSS